MQSHSKLTTPHRGVRRPLGDQVPGTLVNSDSPTCLRVGLSEGVQDPSFLGAGTAIQDKDGRYVCIGKDQVSQIPPASEFKGSAPPFTSFTPNIACAPTGVPVPRERTGTIYGTWG